MFKWIIIALVGFIVLAGSQSERKTRNTAPTKIQASLLQEEAKDYRVDCRLKLKQSARYRTKVVINYVEALQAPKAPHIWFAKGMADLMNDYGAMIPHTFMCKFENQIMVDFAVAPGSH